MSLRAPKGRSNLPSSRGDCFVALRAPRNDNRLVKDLAVVILAAGKGTRMRSELPKALHTVCGEPMLGLVLRKAEALGAKKIIVVAGYGVGRVREFVGNRARVVEQKKLLGSGHAVLQAARALSRWKGRVLVMYCDTPLVSTDTLSRILGNQRQTRDDCVLLSVNLDDPTEYGRIRKNSEGFVQKIIEENDATPFEKAVREINVGAYVFDSKKLFAALKWILKNPKKKEYYLTDAIEILAQSGKVAAVLTENPREALGVNSLADLAGIEQIMQKNILEEWARKGVRIRDPRTTTIDANVTIGSGTVVFPSTVIEGNTRIGKNCRIGPFARIRGASQIGNGVVIGNFVEVVRSRIGDNAQVKHLSYVGDAVVGQSVNIGAGTITANFDGKQKYKTIIKDKAQIGSGTILVAPVTVGRAAKTGAGAVVTKGKNVPDRGIVVGVPARSIG